jgi:hypothetical protein
MLQNKIGPVHVLLGHVLFAKWMTSARELSYVRYVLLIDLSYLLLGERCLVLLGNHLLESFVYVCLIVMFSNWVILL